MIVDKETGFQVIVNILPRNQLFVPPPPCLEGSKEMLKKLKKKAGEG
jgi:hypothetical protein